MKKEDLVEKCIKPFDFVTSQSEKGNIGLVIEKFGCVYRVAWIKKKKTDIGWWQQKNWKK